MVVFGREWFFGGGGIYDLEPGQTPYGTPVQTIEYASRPTTPPALGSLVAQLALILAASPFNAVVLSMGTTSIPRELFIEMLADLRPRYNMTSYDLIKNNCNNFTNDVVTFLTGRPIPPCAFLFCLSRVGLCHPLLTAPLPPLPPLPQIHTVITGLPEEVHNSSISPSQPRTTSYNL